MAVECLFSARLARDLFACGGHGRSRHQLCPWPCSQELIDRRLQLPSIPLTGPLEIHSRDTTNASDAFRVQAKCEYQRLITMVLDTLSSFNTEGSRLVTKQQAAIGEKADKSQLEVLESLQSLVESGRTTLKDLQGLLVQERERQEEAIRSELFAFQSAFEANKQDLQFLAELQEVRQWLC